MAQRKYKVGTRIEIKGFGLDNRPRWEAARITRIERCMLPLPNGYVPTKYDIDGAVLLCHESGFRVTDNRARHDLAVSSPPAALPLSEALAARSVPEPGPATDAAVTEERVARIVAKYRTPTETE